MFTPQNLFVEWSDFEGTEGSFRSASGSADWKHCRLCTVLLFFLFALRHTSPLVSKFVSRFEKDVSLRLWTESEHAEKRKRASVREADIGAPLSAIEIAVLRSSFVLRN